jgi:hypothetical protein
MMAVGAGVGVFTGTKTVMHPASKPARTNTNASEYSLFILFPPQGIG